MSRQHTPSRRGSQRRGRRSPFTTFGLIAVVICVLFGIVLVQQLELSWYPAWITAASLTTFLLYGFDKWQAKAGGPRVPELVLHSLSLAGGFIGGWTGMLWWRHKTQHPSFTLVLLISSLLHAGIWWYIANMG